eukprot:CAMPEP_0198364842 /NCGR_PEP_ID=MMETSP1450-20131203/153871_1 /TAXON_ID=753684 ORGANISM="Madagascaria erythrocladiodes, Strain CCMP3234" /NCGR_SAMPLE_ID=MMETSP1450 /ASSEMBLY_ACC=CAM_ASM_001115 /LENGTH=481 /DNA_ID=CAMNT_0044072283 /DNA_START=142 /DNA_END=1587 /DNA_ORIENTATION=-
MKVVVGVLAIIAITALTNPQAAEAAGGGGVSPGKCKRIAYWIIDKFHCDDEDLRHYAEKICHDGICSGKGFAACKIKLLWLLKQKAKEVCKDDPCDPDPCPEPKTVCEDNTLWTIMYKCDPWDGSCKEKKEREDCKCGCKDKYACKEDCCDPDPCPEDEQKCRDGVLTTKTYECDSDTGDCSSKTDHEDCKCGCKDAYSCKEDCCDPDPCPEDEQKCRDGVLTITTYECDSDTGDCSSKMDHEDCKCGCKDDYSCKEDCCDPDPCPEDEQKCRDGVLTITTYECNSDTGDCSSKSDHEDCKCGCKDDYSCKDDCCDPDPCPEDEQKCRDGVLTTTTYECDSETGDCSSKSDHEDCKCGCKDDYSCKEDCCDPDPCPEDEQKCRDGVLTITTYECDSETGDCSSKTDHEDCKCGCKDDYSCKDDCCDPDPCPEDKTKCRWGWLFKKTYTCDPHDGSCHKEKSKHRCRCGCEDHYSCKEHCRY